MVSIPSEGANKSWRSQEIDLILCSPNVQCSAEHATSYHPQPHDSSLHPSIPVSRAILILSWHVRLGVTCSLFPHIFPKMLCKHFSTLCECYMPCPSNIPLINYQNIWQELQIMKLLVIQFCPFFCHLFRLGQHVLLSIVLPNTLRQYPAFNQYTKFYVYIKNRQNY